MRRPKGHVLEHRHMRIERVVLEHHGDAALGGRQLVDPLAADMDAAAVQLLQPGDHPQQRGLAAARRADENREFFLLDLEVDAVDDLGVAETLDDPVQFNITHLISIRLAFFGVCIDFQYYGPLSVNWEYTIMLLHLT